MYVIGVSRMSFQFDYILAYQRITSRLRGLHTRLCRDKVNYMKENLLIKYSEQLAIVVETMCQNLSRKRGVSNSVLQIRKSSSSVFANVSEAQYPQSLADMLSKLKIARKECMETESWLKLLFSTNYITEETFKNIRNLCGRIRRILTSSCITIENRLK